MLCVQSAHSKPEMRANFRAGKRCETSIGILVAFLWFATAINHGYGPS